MKIIRNRLVPSAFYVARKSPFHCMPQKLLQLMKSVNAMSWFVTKHTRYDFIECIYVKLYYCCKDSDVNVITGTAFSCFTHYVSMEISGNE